MTKKIKVPYGLRNGRSFHITEVENGLGCNCVCIGCGEDLIARTNHKTPHFAHYRSEQCKYALETSLHLIAKEIISDAEGIILPAVEFIPPVNITESNKIYLDKLRSYALDSAVKEKDMGGITPDLLVNSQGMQLMIEIYVTHKVDEAKLKKIRELGISAIEIDLSKCSREFRREELVQRLIHDISCKKWLWHEARESLNGALLSWLPTAPYNEKFYVPGCPLPKNNRGGHQYPEIDDNCSRCTYYVDLGTTPKIIGCLGNQKIIERKRHRDTSDSGPVYGLTSINQLKRLYKDVEKN